MKTARWPFPAFLLSSVAGIAFSQEPADHSSIGRFEDSEIVDYTRLEFDEYVLLTEEVTERVEWDEPGRDRFGRALEGKVTRITYESPENRSTLEVMRAYEDALRGGGFELLFECDDDACGGRGFNHAVVPYDLRFGDEYDDQRYLAAWKSRPEEGDIYASIYIIKALNTGGPTKNRVYTQVDVVEEAPREGRVIVVEADDMAREIGQSGKVALYGLYFATDEATIEPESKPTLDEIGKLLQDNPEMRLLVVGHTDNQGGFDYNIDLSTRRAATVADALINDYGIDSGRLRPWGVGYTAPVASNATEEGRARNRRVELVAQ